MYASVLTAHDQGHVLVLVVIATSMRMHYACVCSNAKLAAVRTLRLMLQFPETVNGSPPG